MEHSKIFFHTSIGRVRVFGNGEYIEGEKWVEDSHGKVYCVNEADLCPMDLQDADDNKIYFMTPETKIELKRSRHAWE